MTHTDQTKHAAKSPTNSEAVRSGDWLGSCAECKRDTSGEMTWPGEKGAEICQECWEAECSRSWWVMVSALNAAGLLEEPSNGEFSDSAATGGIEAK
jgi:hypothetical protein